MAARRALVRIDGDTRQLPPEDTLAGATRLNALDGDATLLQGTGVTVTTDPVAKTVTISATGGGDVSGKVNRSGDTMTGPLNYATTASVPFPNGVLDLASVTSNIVNLTHVGGARTITSFGTAPAGTTRTLISTGAGAKFIAVSANILIYGVALGTSLQFIVGYSAEFVSLGGGVWQALWFSTVSGGPISITLPSATVAGLPAASSVGAGVMRYCTDMAGRAAPVYSDGTNWRRFSDDSVVTT